MRWTKRALGIAGGALATGAAVGVLARGAKKGRASDQLDGEPLGELVPDRTSTVAAEDGAPLYVAEVDPADGSAAELAIVYVHGFALSQRSWYFQRRDLAALTVPRVRQVFYDHRSHGRSARAPAETHTLEQLGRDLGTVLRSLAPTGPVVLIGHSMGGMTIMSLAEQEPELFAERISGVALVSTAAGEVGGRGLPRGVLSRYNPVTRGVRGLASWQPGLVELARAAGGQLTRPAVRRLAFGDRDVSPRLVDFMMDMLNDTPVQVLTEFVDTLGAHNRYAALAGLKFAETQVISGDADLLTQFSHAERIAAELPNAELVRVRGAGHMAMLEQTEFVNSALIDLLQRASGRTDTRSSSRRWLWKAR
ncbi:pimeloyl-ACP methyl ester carboxylesterase [Tamaricihabitans halophyticus]|uniref:Pimeloyl-ACP methyl ester carboxylesterase n=1 Tax=Tamaricihabitans halophyticus TaxID=1262583 RepID=A0A4R2QVX8_9PSEU|nr:alpha/beta hydrolase [Tamaricihabitans halophyticus]TCP53259.1 pimeloyl-ACP methyl ester carboxylesterase [Tamaricihabitans halophyticus]